MLNTIPHVQFIPGTQCNALMWQASLNALETPIEIEHTPIYRGNTGPEMEAEIIERLAHYPHLVGFSLGAYLAMSVAIKHPDKVASLMIVAGSAQGLAEKEIKARRTMSEWIRNNPYRGMTDKRIAQLLCEHSKDDQQIIECIKEMDNTLGKSVLLAQFDSTSIREDLTPKLVQIQCPVRVIAADLDTIAAQRVMQDIAAHIEGSHFSLATDCGHMIPMEKPTWFARQLAAHFATI